MTDDITVALLFRFSSEERIEDFVINGHIHMANVDYFPTVEDNSLRGDPDENLTQICQKKILN